MGDDLGCNNTQIHEMESGQSCKTIYMTKVKGSERRSFIFTFRLNIAQRDSYQVDEFVTEIEVWKQKVQANLSKALAEFY